MPQLFSLKCNQCDFEIKLTSGGYMYVTDEDSTRIVCPHPVEYHKIAEVLKISPDDAFAYFQQKYEKISEDVRKKIDNNTGFNLLYLCPDCLAEVYLDPKRDEIKCAKCASSKLIFVRDLADKPCPKCKKGTVKIADRGIS